MTASVKLVASQPLHPRQLSEEAVEERTVHEKTRLAFFQVLSSTLELMEKKRQPFAICIDQIAPGRQTKFMKKIVALATRYYYALVEEGKEVAPSDPDELKNWMDHVGINGGIFLDSQRVHSVLEVSIPESLDEYLAEEPKTLSCFDYAFCQINEKRSLLGNYDNWQVPRCLESWGYTPISDPEPGDIVLYLNEGIPMHLGVYKGDNLVQSKWGNENHVAFLHPLESIPISYGNEVVFYRPPPEIATAL